MKQRYYFCAYSTVIRWSGKVSSPEQAARECFGVVERVTVLDVGTKSPSYFSYAKKMELEQKLKELHRERTGMVIGAD